MAATNCNITTTTKSIFDKKRYGLQSSIEDIESFVRSYLSSLGCVDPTCYPIEEPCDRLIAGECVGFILPSFKFTQQTYGSNVDFIVDENDVNGTGPYTYQWNWDEDYFSIRVAGSDQQSTVKLTKLQEDSITMKYRTNVSVTITDANGCTYTKTCEFRYVKVNGVSTGELNCGTIAACTAPQNITITNKTNTSFTLNWTDLGYQYIVVINKIGFPPIYTNNFGASPINIGGLEPGATYHISITNKGCDLESTQDTTTNSIPSAAINCGGAVLAPTDIFVGVGYTGTLTMPYTSGNGIAYNQVILTDSGLTFTLPAGTLNTGSGNLIFSVTGIPTDDIALLINLFGTSCTINKTVIPPCQDVAVVNVTIGNFNSFTNLYDVTISWAAVPNAVQYIVFDGTNTFSTTNLFFQFQVPPGTAFSGTVTTDCSLGSLGDPTPYDGVTPDAECELFDFTVANIVDDGFSVTNITPVLLPGENYGYELFLQPSVTPTQSGVSNTFPLVFTGLVAGTYTIVITKLCNVDLASDPIEKEVEITGPPEEPTVYVSFDYTMSEPVPSDTYGGDPCNNLGQHFSMVSKPALVNVRTWSDPAGTIPLNVTGMGIVVNYQLRNKNGNYTCPAPGTPVTLSNVTTPGTLAMSSTSTSYSNPSGQFEDMYGGAFDCGGGDCRPTAWSQRTFELLPGIGYTVI